MTMAGSRPGQHPRHCRVTRYLDARGSTTDEVEDQDDDGDDEQQVDEPAADAAEQAEQPENGQVNRDPKQHDDSLMTLWVKIWMVLGESRPGGRFRGNSKGACDLLPSGAPITLPAR